jgi:hypothetical protein
VQHGRCVILIEQCHPIGVIGFADGVTTELALDGGDTDGTVELVSTPVGGSVIFTSGAGRVYRVGIP